MESFAATSPLLRRRFPVWVAILILAAVTFAAYWPILGSDFSQWDDAEQIARNEYLIPPAMKGLLKRWSGPFMNIYIPLTHTVWFVLAFFAQTDVPEGGVEHLAPFPFKLTNVAVHAGTGCIVFLILAKLLRSRLLALLGAALFCLHPVQVESVGWTSGLKDLLFGFFGSACVLFYLGDPRSGFRLSSRAVLMSVAMMLCACLSKPTALVLPAMLFVIDWQVARRSIRETLPRLLPFIIMSVVCAAYARYAQPATELDVHPSLLDRVLVPAHSFAFYLSKLFWPTRLAFDYGVSWDRLLGSRTLYLAWIAPAVLAVAAFALRRRVPLLAAGLLLAIIPLAPVSGVVVFDFSAFSITADHYLYLPMLGIALAITALLQSVSIRTALVLSVPVLLVLAVLTFRQSLIWRTGLTSTLHTLEVNPNSFSSYGILAIEEVATSGGDPAKLKRAEEYARKAVALRADNPRTLNMLANVLSAQGRYEEALAAIDEAIRLSKTDPAYHLARAGILGEMQRGEESIAELREVLRYNPDHRTARELVAKWEAILREQRRTGPPPATAPASRPNR